MRNCCEEKVKIENEESFSNVLRQVIRKGNQYD